MKLLSIQMRNFRKHTDRKVTFTDGLNVVRAENEGGKSTMYEAIAYAMGGSRALSTSLEEAVTWGENPRTLRVSLEVESAGVIYTINRSLAGAEVLKGADVFCTGQTEVTNWVAQNLVQADAKMASKLMFSSQGNLRGALDAGPTALAEMIESLADMSVFDDILDKAQTKWTLGPTQGLEQQLARARADLAGSQSAMEGLGVVDHADHESVISQLQAKQEVAAQSAGLVHSKLEEAQGSLNALISRRDTREKRAGAYREKQAWIEQNQGKLVQLVAETKKAIPDIKTLEAQLTEALAYESKSTAFAAFQSVKPLTFDYSAGEDHFETMREEAGQTLNRVNNEIGDLISRKTLVLKDRINHQNCDKCGQDVSHLKTVQETNARVDGEVAQIEGKLTELQSLRPVLEEQYTQLQNTAKQVREFRMACAQAKSQWTQLTDTFPPVFEWVGGEVSSEVPDVQSIRRELSKAQDVLRTVTEAQGKVTLLTEQIEEQKAEAAQLLTSFQAIEEVYDTELTAAQDVVNTFTDREAEILREVLMLGNSIEVEKSEFNKLKAQVELFEQIINRNRTQVAELEQAIELQQFRTNLVKKVKALRPFVANKLWNTLLTGASVMYSQLRGEDSIITKEKEGFLVNGKPVESYSGSAKDMLGLALRCALVRTFLPNCALLALDEPGQGCSKARTEVMLGFLSSTGFKQTLLVTHDDLAEQVANNLIQF